LIPAKNKHVFAVSACSFQQNFDKTTDHFQKEGEG